MTRVKICGITNSEDARAAVDYGADALGFVLIPESPRCIDIFAAQDIARSLPPFAQTVLLLESCVDKPVEILMAANYRIAGFGAVQFYAGDCVRWLPGMAACIRAFRIRDESSLEEISAYLGGKDENPPPDAILLDAYHKDKLGGSGETFNWNLAAEAKKRFDIPIILAGGLTPENVAEAIAKVQPHAVDVSSGVEAEPGRKDHAKLKAFIRAVRRADL